MTFDAFHTALLWCAVINYAVLLLWFAVFAFCRGWLAGFHGRWFALSPERFDAAHYVLMGVYKLGILLFFIVPYGVLHIVK
ncbi:MAG: hypothetical protein KF859_08070 [Phycisphaeraceae bacterium]|nr:hypothetical protein [Phycisphaeraceae bacterium]